MKVPIRQFSSTANEEKENEKEVIDSGAVEEEMVFPYAFMNTDADLVLPTMFCQDQKKLEKQSKVLNEIQTIMEPDHESGIHDHFKELYIRYLEALAMIDDSPEALE